MTIRQLAKANLFLTFAVLCIVVATVALLLSCGVRTR